MLANWVKQAVTAGGTGNLTLGSADAGFIDFNTAIGQGPRFVYDIEDTGQRETGIGYLSASTTLVRETILETLVGATFSRSSPSALDISTSANVMIAANARNLLESAKDSINVGTASTKYQLDAFGGVASSSSTQGANRLFLWSMFLPCDGFYTGASIFVATAASGGLFRLGIYQALGGQVCVKRAGTAEMSSASATLVTGSFDEGTVFLPAGFYVAVSLSSAAHAFRADTGVRGHLPSDVSAGSSVQAFTGSLTYGSLPSSIDMSSNGLNTSNYATSQPRMGLVRA